MVQSDHTKDCVEADKGPYQVIDNYTEAQDTMETPLVEDQARVVALPQPKKAPSVKLLNQHVEGLDALHVRKEGGGDGIGSGVQRWIQGTSNQPFL